LQWAEALLERILLLAESDPEPWFRDSRFLYVHFSSGSALDLLRQIVLELDLEPAHFRGDLVRQISGGVVRLNQSKKQHPF
jgi:hypothetical protein